MDRLVERGLAERTDDGHRLTAAGAALYDDVEATTDALGEQFWARPELDDALQAIRPYVKAVIDAACCRGRPGKADQLGDSGVVGHDGAVVLEG